MTATKNYYWGALRILMGWIFLWAFMDKLFGLGFATKPEKSWLHGNSPTSGFLSNSPHGPFENIFKGMAGSALVDWLFMMGLLLIGLALIFGIAMKLACYSGALLMFFMWLALIPPANNPIIDDHIIYLLLLLGLQKTHAGDFLGLGKWWKNTALVKNLPFLS